MNRRAVRKARNLLALGLSGVATAIGLFFLGAILWTLIKNGLSGISPRVFTAMTPPPGSSGGLLNAIYGSVVMTVLGILIGGPIGMLAGTYLAEYGRTTRISTVIRFVNDVLLSAPVDHYRTVCVRASGRAHGTLLCDRRGRGARHHRDAGHGAHH